MICVRQIHSSASLSSRGFRGKVHQTIRISSASATPASSSNQVISNSANVSMPTVLNRNRQIKKLAAAALTVLIAACAGREPPSAPPAPTDAKAPAETAQPPVAPPMPMLLPASWDAIPDWQSNDPVPAWNAFLASCEKLGGKPLWQPVCSQAAMLKSAAPADPATLRNFFQTYFTPHAVLNADGSDEGLITGYYEPLLQGSKKKSTRFRYPVYGVPDDLLTIDLAELYPELKGMRLRGRVEGKRVVPYHSRAAIEQNGSSLAAREIVWVDDPVELFFLQIQGSGRVKLEDGELLKIGYADQNGYPYRSIGKLLVERGEMTLEQASMQSIKAWAKQNPEKLPELLNQNASYVFFRELPNNLSGPIGSLGVPLTAGRSLAIDPRVIPQGAPIFLATTWPDSSRALNRLMVAQDTGGAIRGAVRADLFWGFGDAAGALAGKMKQAGKLWVLLPNSPET
ncbi:MAG: MltA domain-containing protein [Burkholderiales bacterium]|nr:MltA domain-containing protein [Burkholderiales bacterium]